MKGCAKNQEKLNEWTAIIKSKMKHILKCSKCGSYALNEECPCGGKRIEHKPPKYTPQDKYAHYRREAKKQIEENEKHESQ